MRLYKDKQAKIVLIAVVLMHVLLAWAAYMIQANYHSIKESARSAENQRLFESCLKIATPVVCVDITK